MSKTSKEMNVSFERNEFITLHNHKSFIFKRLKPVTLAMYLAGSLINLQKTDAETLKAQQTQTIGPGHMDDPSIPLSKRETKDIARKTANRQICGVDEVVNQICDLSIQKEKESSPFSKSDRELFAYMINKPISYIESLPSLTLLDHASLLGIYCQRQKSLLPSDGTKIVIPEKLAISRTRLIRTIEAQIKRRNIWNIILLRLQSFIKSHPPLNEYNSQIEKTIEKYQLPCDLNSVSFAYPISSEKTEVNKYNLPVYQQKLGQALEVAERNLQSDRKSLDMELGIYQTALDVDPPKTHGYSDRFAHTLMKRLKRVATDVQPLEFCVFPRILGGPIEKVFEALTRSSLRGEKAWDSIANIKATFTVLWKDGERINPHEVKRGYVALFKRPQNIIKRLNHDKTKTKSGSIPVTSTSSKDQRVPFPDLAPQEHKARKLHAACKPPININYKHYDRNETPVKSKPLLKTVRYCTMLSDKNLYKALRHSLNKKNMTKYKNSGNRNDQLLSQNNNISNQPLQTLIGAAKALEQLSLHKTNNEFAFRNFFPNLHTNHTPFPQSRTKEPDDPISGYSNQFLTSLTSFNQSSYNEDPYEEAMETTSANVSMPLPISSSHDKRFDSCGETALPMDLSGYTNGNSNIHSLNTTNGDQPQLLNLYQTPTNNRLPY